jgi:hypothetical protein
MKERKKMLRMCERQMDGRKKREIKVKMRNYRDRRGWKEE